MQDDNDKEDMQSYRAGLTILELMTVLAVLGGLLTWVLRQFFMT